MLDLYLVVTPVFSLLTILTLVTMKKALTAPQITDIKQYAPLLQTQTTIRMTDNQNKPSHYLRTFCFMLKAYTLAQLFFGNRSALKIPLLLTISAVSILCYLVPSMYAFCFIGTILTIIYATGCVLGQKQGSQANIIPASKSVIESQNVNFQQFNKNENKQKLRIQQLQPKKLEVILIFCTIVFYLIMIGVTFKNYYNIELQVMLVNICINLLIDSFLVRPLIFACISYPLSRLQMIQSFIQRQEIIVQILTKKRVKRVVQISKAKRIQSPVKFRQEPGNDQNKQNVLSLKADLRKIKLHKSSLPPLATTPLSLKKNEGLDSGDCSIVSLFNSGQKNKRNYGNLSFDLGKTFQEACEQCEQDCQDRLRKQNIIKKEKTMRNSNLIMVNPDQSKIKQFYEVQNQEQQDQKQRTQNNKSEKDHQSIGQSRRNSDVLKFTLNNTINDDQNDYQNQNQDRHNNSNTIQDQNNNNQFPSINHSKTNGLLLIREDRGGEDLQQIDLNSPQRRNKRMSAKGEDQITNSQAKPKKKKYKKFSMDANRRVLKHSTGDPYLEDQTKMLDFQLKIKKNQQSGSIFRKTQINQSKLINSVRRVKNTKDPIVRQNDQNQLPSFQIQDL